MVAVKERKSDAVNYKLLVLVLAKVWCCRKGYPEECLLWSPFHQNEYKYSHKSGAMGHLFSKWCLEAHQGFKLLPEFKV